MSDMPLERGRDAVPLLTVALPIFNAGHYLKLAVLSISKQTFRDWELIIIDDGSTDNALQEIASIYDHRIRILRDGMNKGLASRLNEAIALARGRFFARMDQDDVSYPERFARQIQFLQDNPRLDVAVVRAITITEDNEVIGFLPCPLTHEEICARPWQGFCFPHPIWMGKIEWFRKHKYAIPGPYFCEDQELLLRSYSKSRFGSVDNVLFAYRLRSKHNWKRVVKTRWTLFKIQSHHFIRSKQIRYVLLSFFVLVGLVARDFLRMVQQLYKKPYYSLVNISPDVSSAWLATLEALQDNCCTKGKADC